MERKQALMFEAEVKDGVLVLPEEYRDEVTGRVSVILLLEGAPTAQASAEERPLQEKTGQTLSPSESPESEEEPEEDFLDWLMRNPYEVPDFKPMTREEIYDRGRSDE